METELAIQEAPASSGLSVVLSTLRADWAEAVSRVVDQAATKQGANLETFRQIRGKMLHYLFLRISRKGTHFLETEETIRRLRRLADRLIQMELRRHAKNRLPWGNWVLDDEETRRLLDETRYPQGPIRPGTVMKAWEQLTFLEQRVRKLTGLSYQVDDIALILGLTPNAVMFYLNQATGKLHNIYKKLY